MRLPRRVPWATIAELDQVCSWIYADENDLHANTLAINRLSAWKAITTLPHALESALSLLVVIQQDKSTTDTSYNHLSLRHSYAAAIIRLVNGLVDPLQLGVYARSISSIAAQLGLPAWLVELRHAATHEDLPSLEVLREAARQSMSWLFDRYFLPTINPSSAPKLEMPPLRPLSPILKQYKIVMKTIIRDVSLRSKLKNELNAITRNIERWMSETKVAANIIGEEAEWDLEGNSANGIQEGRRNDNMDSKEKWALERFCDALLDQGGLVPLSKKKRVFPEDKFWPPQLSVSVWTPLLKHIQLLHMDFAYILCMRMLSLLLPVDGGAITSPQTQSNSPSVEITRDPSHDVCLARWVMWSINNWSHPNQAGTDKELKKDVAIVLMQRLGRTMSDLSYKDTKPARTLLRALCPQNPGYVTALEFLSKSPVQYTSMKLAEEDMMTMTNRLTRFVSSSTNKSPASSSAVKLTSTAAQHAPSPAMDTKSDDLPPGWKRLTSVTWKPCPIGVFQRP